MKGLNIYHTLRKDLGLKLLLAGSTSMQLMGIDYPSEKKDVDLLLNISEHPMGFDIEIHHKLFDLGFTTTDGYVADEFGTTYSGKAKDEDGQIVDVQIFVTDHMFHDRIFSTEVEGRSVEMVSPMHNIIAKHKMLREKDIHQLQYIADMHIKPMLLG